MRVGAAEAPERLGGGHPLRVAAGAQLDQRDRLLRARSGPSGPAPCRARPRAPDGSPRRRCCPSWWRRRDGWPGRDWRDRSGRRTRRSAGGSRCRRRRPVDTSSSVVRSDEQRLAVGAGERPRARRRGRAGTRVLSPSLSLVPDDDGLLLAARQGPRRRRCPRAAPRAAGGSCGRRSCRARPRPPPGPPRRREATSAMCLAISAEGPREPRGGSSPRSAPLPGR